MNSLKTLLFTLLQKELKLLHEINRNELEILSIITHKIYTNTDKTKKN